jgi:outer membrane protein W
MNKLLISTITLSLLASTAMAAEGSSITRFRFGMSSASTAKISDLTSSANVTISGKKPVKNGFSGEISNSYFFNNNVALETSVALSLVKTAKSATVTAAGTTAGYKDITAASVSKSRNYQYVVPLMAIAQYHLQPGASTNPYIGIGYQYSISAKSGKLLKTQNSHGPVAQIGLDLMDKDGSGFNIDVKKVWNNKVKVSHKTVLDNNGLPVKSKLKYNPFIASVGISWMM